MSDTTLVYYTANRITPHFADAVMHRLLDSCDGRPIVTVSQEPLPAWFRAAVLALGGQNIVLPGIGASIYNVYRQVLIGAEAARTTYVACCEDDTLYVPEHFAHRPAADTFAYNHNRWVVTRRLSDDRRSRVALYYWRERTQMAMCVAPRALMVETLHERFARYPNPVSHEEAKRTGWGEPGRYERNLGLTPRKRAYFRTDLPCLTFNHASSLMGRRQIQPGDLQAHTLEPWGEATALWEEIHG